MLSEDDFICPKCGEKPAIHHTCSSRKYSTAALVTPWFTCVKCYGCGYSKQLVRQIVSQYRNDSFSKMVRRYSHKEIYEDAIGFLEEIMRYEIARGKKRLKFKKVTVK